jgi:hypothetical protein
VLDAQLLGIEEALAACEPLLYGYNYQVFVRLYRVDIPEHSPTAAYLVAALGAGITFRDETPSTVTAMVAEVEECLRYEGDAASGPLPGVLDSPQFGDHLARLKAGLDAAAIGRTITRVDIADGHPAYPVFWDFSYVVAGKGSFVLVGCSSD